MVKRSGGPLFLIILVWAVGMVGIHMLRTQRLFMDARAFYSLHLGLILGLVYLDSMRKASRNRPLRLVLFILSLAAAGYVGYFIEDLSTRAGFPTATDLVVGVLLVILVLEGTRLTMGLTLPVVAVAFLTYAWLGHYLPGGLRAYEISLPTLLYQVSTFLDGIYGPLLAISANYVFLYVVFGGFLQAFGVSRFIAQLGRLLGKTLRSGPAMVAVVGSGLIGSVVMSPAANIAICGSYTIPLMKRVGYKPHQAAAIEAAASTSGQITPPVMSAAAFIMASITGITYARICLAAVIPALLYLWSVGSYAHLQAGRLGIQPVQGDVNVRDLLLESRLFFGPLIVLVMLLAIGLSPSYAVFWAIVATIGIGLMRPKTLPSLKDWLARFVDGVRAAAMVGVSMALLGIVIKVLTMTGLGIRFPAIVDAWSGGNVYIALALVALVSLILGMGVPTAGAYLLVAMTAAPYLINHFGFSVLQAHFYAFYFACMSHLTPPVAPAAVVSSAIAGSGYIRTAVESVKPAIVGFLAPIAFIWMPFVLAEPTQAGILQNTVILIGLFAGILFVQAAFVCYLVAKCSFVERVLLAVAGTLLVLNVVWHMWMVVVLAIGMGCITGFMQRNRLGRAAVRLSIE